MLDVVGVGRAEGRVKAYGGIMWLEAWAEAWAQACEKREPTRKRKRNQTQKEMVPEGVEPSTLALLAPHSNQLSYGTDVKSIFN